MVGNNILDLMIFDGHRYMGAKMDFEEAIWEKTGHAPGGRRKIFGVFSCSNSCSTCKIGLGKNRVFWGKIPLFDFRKLGGMWIWACIGVFCKEEQGIVYCTVYENEGLFKGFIAS